MRVEDKSKLVEVFSGALMEVQLLKTMLQDNGIESALKDNDVVNVVLPSSNVDVALLVNEKDYEAAAKVVKAYKDSEGEE